MNEILDMYDKKSRQTGFTKHYLTLFAMVEGMNAKKTFEFGTGISTKMILKALEYTNGTHTSCDVRDLEDTGLSLDLKNNYLNKWNYIQKNSMLLTEDELKTAGPFDFVLHDGSHIPGEVRKDLIKILPHMKQGSLLAIHDTVQPNDNLYEASTMALSNIEKEILTLPYGYGLTLVIINENFGNGHIDTNWRKNS